VRILFCGDIVGKAGRDVVVSALPALRRDMKIDFVVANGENAAHGFGMTEKICMELFDVGVDVITGGNHTWDKAEIIPVLERDKRILRPINYPAGTPGRGSGAFTDGRGRRILVVNIMARLFMELLDDPFQAILDVLPLAAPKHARFEAVLIDLHGEATSEKMAFAHMVDGRATLVVGTHTHVPTADAMILNGGTAYQTDAGMCGDYNSVIGMTKEPSINNFLRKMPRQRMSPADGEGTLCGVMVESDDRTGLAVKVAPVRVGGRLSPTENSA
jgi:2',3'-cyclic-nucleotide 2'-phosphodiesterase